MHAPINGGREAGEGPIVAGSPIWYRHICVSHYILEQPVWTEVASRGGGFLYIFSYTAKINRLWPSSPGVMY